MKQTDLSITLDMVLQSDDEIPIALKRAIVEEIIDRFSDSMSELKLPVGISYNGFTIDGAATKAEDRGVAKREWNDLVMITKGRGQRPDPSRREGI